MYPKASLETAHQSLRPRAAHLGDLAGRRERTMLMPRTEHRPRPPRIIYQPHPLRKAGRRVLVTRAAQGACGAWLAFHAGRPATGRPLRDAGPSNSAQQDASAPCRLPRFLPAARSEPRLGVGGSARGWNWELGALGWPRTGEKQPV